MSTAEMIALASAIAAPLLTFFGVLIGAAKGRADSKEQNATAVRELEVKARMASEAAANDARREVTQAWESYAASMQKDRKLLVDRLEAVEARASASEKRLDSAETRAVIAEERASRWESLYRIAVAHLREVIRWATVNNTGAMPEPPAELQREL
jgi:hypothetical protein